MIYRPKRINQAWWIIPTALLVIGILSFVGVSYFGFPRIVFRPLFFVCFVAAIFFYSRYALQSWEYGLTEPSEEYPCGKLQIFSVRGKRTVPYADLDLCEAVSLIPDEEDKALGDEGKRPAFLRTYAYVLNLFPKDIFYLYIGFRENNLRLRLELTDETFLCALQSRVLEATKLPKARRRHSLHDPADEEDYGDGAAQEPKDAAEAAQYDPAASVDPEAPRADAPDADGATPPEAP